MIKIMLRPDLKKACLEIFRNCEVSPSKRICMGNLVAERNVLENGLPYIIIADAQLFELEIDKLKIK